jgi:hypothetical protein
MVSDRITPIVRPVISDAQHCFVTGFVNRFNVIPGFHRGGHLRTIFFVLDINGALDLFENMSMLRYADDLKLFMTIKCIGDCQLFKGIGTFWANGAVVINLI